MEIIIENMDVSVVYFFVGIFNNVLMRLVAFSIFPRKCEHKLHKPPVVKGKCYSVAKIQTLSYHHTPTAHSYFPIIQVSVLKVEFWLFQVKFFHVFAVDFVRFSKQRRLSKISCLKDTEMPRRKPVRKFHTVFSLKKDPYYLRNPRLDFCVKIVPSIHTNMLSYLIVSKSTHISV